MVSLVDHVDVMVTLNEVEALILENILIKKEKPRFNVMLRDDKTYPYLKLTVGEKFPRLAIVRKMLDDGALYFGPYVSAKSVRAVKRLIHRLFPLRQSSDNLDKAPLRKPCLNYHMKRCLAPCAGKVSPEEYGQVVQSVIRFIQGREDEVVAELRKDMELKASRQEFERAAALRDQIEAIKRIREKQEMDAASGRLDEDYIAAVCEGGTGVVRIMMVRGGKLMGDQNYILKKADDPAELVEVFVKQFYGSPFAVPSEIFVNIMPEESEVLAKWLSRLRGKKVKIVQPRRGRKKRLTGMVEENARLKLLQVAAGQESRKEALREIQEMLGLEKWPVLMEAVDISNIHGVSAVGSLVAFFNGEPDKSRYRRYRIKTAGRGDTEMIAEVVDRRFRRIMEEGGKFADILVVDGGKGQVNAAVSAARKYAPEQAVLGIAKGPERENSASDLFYIAGKRNPVPFLPAGPGRFMLQRLRDESHRFAIDYHRKTRSRGMFKSGVDEVKGFGPKRKKKLVLKFGSLKAARNATAEEIAKVLSVNTSLASEILEKL
jgi:excinuclease ABC subunit C